jgi:hypothetical protein
MLLCACGGGSGSSSAFSSSADVGHEQAAELNAPDNSSSGVATIQAASPTPPSNTTSVPSAPGASQVVFSGRTWEVRSSPERGGPRSNLFDAKNVWVDSRGFLHLKISQADGVWSAAELYTTERLGFGRYQFKILGHPETMDKSIVFGLFNYPTEDVGVDGTNEIDIEFATWGGAQTVHGNWSVWPAVPGVDYTHKAYDAALNTDQSTHRFVWSKKSVIFQSLRGQSDSSKGLYRQWTFAPRDFSTRIPQAAMPLHMNLWIYSDSATPVPSDGKEREIVVTEFKYTPL